jgi:hypothetical protein
MSGATGISFEIYKNNVATGFSLATGVTGNYLNTSQSVRFTPDDNFDSRFTIVGNPANINVVASYSTY